VSELKPLILLSNHFFSKYGFDEGEQLGEWLFDNCYTYDGRNENILIEKDLFDFINKNDERLLVEIIKEFLIPEIEKNHNIEIEFIDHKNPIRISKIDGRIVDWYCDYEYPIKPKRIEIKPKQLLKYLKRKKRSE